MTGMSDVSFKEYLREYADIKGLNIKKLSDETGIPERYLEALLEGNLEDLPPSPYIRGYIGKLATALEFDKEEMWRLYKKENSSPENGSGPLDRLPSNRYAIKVINKKFIIIAAIGVLVLSYVGWNINKLLGTARLDLIYPTSENLIVRQPTISIEGKTETNAKLTINDSEIFVDEDGRFEKELSLNTGLNVITISSKKFLGKEVSITRKIIYEPIEIVEETNENKNGQ